jgi:hypothetical protein
MERWKIMDWMIAFCSLIQFLFVPVHGSDHETTKGSTQSATLLTQQDVGNPYDGVMTQYKTCCLYKGHWHHWCHWLGSEGMFWWNRYHLVTTYATFKKAFMNWKSEDSNNKCMKIVALCTFPHLISSTIIDFRVLNCINPFAVNYFFIAFPKECNVKVKN